VSPIAERTATTRVPRLWAATIRAATSFSFSGSPTDVPPNFITMVPARAVASPATAGTASNSVIATP